MNILIELPEDRARLGRLSGGGCGPFVCDGKSDDAAAIAAGNPSRDPEKPFGDTPLGEYRGAIVYEIDATENRRSYGLPDATGKIPTIALVALKGNTQAWRALLNGRVGLKIHAGQLNAAGSLRPTHGCVRMGQTDFTKLVALLPSPPTSAAVSISTSIVELRSPGDGEALPTAAESSSA